MWVNDDKETDKLAAESAIKLCNELLFILKYDSIITLYYFVYHLSAIILLLLFLIIYSAVKISTLLQAINLAVFQTICQ